MDYSRGYSASFYGTFVDPSTMRDYDRFEIIDGSITRGKDELRQSASLTVRGFVEDFNDQIIRIYMQAEQDGERETVPLFTGLASSPDESFAAGIVKTSISCYSLLKIADDVALPIGWYAPAFTSGPEKIKELLDVIGVDIVSDYDDGEDEESNELPYYILDSAVIAESGETNMSMVEKILSIIDWRLQIEGDGTIYLSSAYPEDIAVSTIISPEDNDVIETSFSRTIDWFNCPNVFRATYGDYSATARDDDPESELSTVSRGREVWMVEDNASLREDESIGEYAQRRLTEEQIRSETVSYGRRFLPEVNQGDKIRIDYPELQGDFLVETQSISLGYNAKVNETISRYI